MIRQLDHLRPQPAYDEAHPRPTRRALCKDDGPRRRLVGRHHRPHPHAYRREDQAYHLMIPERRVESAALNAFRDWLLDEARAWMAQQA